MKHFFFSALLLVASSTAVFAQSKDKPTNPSSSLLSSGTLYQGLSRSVPNARVVLPYGLEVTFDKTTHLIFPAPIRYVDLGSQTSLLAKRRMRKMSCASKLPCKILKRRLIYR